MSTIMLLNCKELVTYKVTCTAYTMYHILIHHQTGGGGGGGGRVVNPPPPSMFRGFFFFESFDAIFVKIGRTVPKLRNVM